MRLNGEDSCGEEEEDRKAEEAGTTSFSGENCCVQKVVVGYALTSKKKKSFLQPKLIALARSVSLKKKNNNFVSNFHKWLYFLFFPCFDLIIRFVFRCFFFLLR